VQAGDIAVENVEGQRQRQQEERSPEVPVAAVG
jgi:hypothetical protein